MASTSPRKCRTALTRLLVLMLAWTQAVSAKDPDPPKALDQNATANDLRWQPSLDFDRDGCYNVPAIGRDGKIAEGLEAWWTHDTTHCRDRRDLDNNNVYSRQRCNMGWCVYLYAYYFEKTTTQPDTTMKQDHRHDWQHIAVWVKDDKAEWVAGSTDGGGYDLRPASEVRWDGEHPKMVYHKAYFYSHCFRFAMEKDDRVENHKKEWFRGALVSHNGFPPGIRDLLYAHDFGVAKLALTDERFPKQINDAKPERMYFDAHVDEGSPGTPGQ